LRPLPLDEERGAFIPVADLGGAFCPAAGSGTLAGEGAGDLVPGVKVTWVEVSSGEIGGGELERTSGREELRTSSW
jgi:hypothetical protein